MSNSFDYFLYLSFQILNHLLKFLILPLSMNYIWLTNICYNDNNNRENIWKPCETSILANTYNLLSHKIK